ncbi:LOW QUALITY PROTEIN: Rve domain containing hypothetical protein [Phytophthora palmivora]|uniref:Integrase catalytic domain-containing protein n=1 Tax=Phytophthora palmivora TaxID=4796 RepID=A0A2P4YVR4_9STRA|nr:LOW QUALITY PROTEIN: Rve domain containing hypothetical protein [Phytophthora palmivora]
MNQSWSTCVSGKLTKKSFSSKDKRVLKKNQILLAINYAGPIQVTSREGYTGMVNIVVEPFHLDMVYPLREKSSHSQLTAVKDSNAPSYRVAVVKFDNTAKYMSGEFAAFYEKNDIIQEFSPPYSPQQNGKVERVNRVTVVMGRSMVIGANFPTAYWAEAFVCAAYVRNRCPTKVFDGKTPMGAFPGKEHDISNLHVFGCKELVPKKHHTKLGSKTCNGIFIGYAADGAYLVYIPRRGTGDIVTTRMKRERKLP